MTEQYIFLSLYAGLIAGELRDPSVEKITRFNAREFTPEFVVQLESVALSAGMSEGELEVLRSFAQNLSRDAFFVTTMNAIQDEIDRRDRKVPLAS